MDEGTATAPTIYTYVSHAKTLQPRTAAVANVNLYSAPNSTLFFCTTSAGSLEAGQVFVPPYFYLKILLKFEEYGCMVSGERHIHSPSCSCLHTYQCGAADFHN